MRRSHETPLQLKRTRPTLVTQRYEKSILFRERRYDFTSMFGSQSSVRQVPTTRREFLCRCGMGFGAVALTSLLEQTVGATPVNAAPSGPFWPKAPPFRARAK